MQRYWQLGLSLQRQALHARLPPSALPSEALAAAAATAGSPAELSPSASISETLELINHHSAALSLGGGFILAVVSLQHVLASKDRALAAQLASKDMARAAEDKTLAAELAAKDRALAAELAAKEKALAAELAKKDLQWEKQLAQLEKQLVEKDVLLAQVAGSVSSTVLDFITHGDYRGLTQRLKSLAQKKL